MPKASDLGNFFEFREAPSPEDMEAFYKHITGVLLERDRKIAILELHIVQLEGTIDDLNERLES